MAESSHAVAALRAPGRDFVIGFALAAVACGGVLAERLSCGNVRVGLTAQLLLTVAVVLATHKQRRVEPVVVFQGLGGILAIALTHLLLRTTSVGSAPWLSERAPQLVNDAVAVFAPLAIAWAASRRPPRTAVLAGLLVVLSLYRLTSACWHVDTIAFGYSVQDLVTGELAGSALGVATFRLLA